MGDQDPKINHPVTERKSGPHNLDAEQALLGAILLNNEAMRFVADFLKPQHFYEPLHQQIFDICATLITAGKLATPVTIKAFLPVGLKVGPLSGVQYLARLAAEATSVIHAADYGKLIYDHADRRDIVSIAERLMDDVATDPAELAGIGIDVLDGIVSKRSETGSPSLAAPEAAARAIDAIAAAYQRDGRISGLTWGLRDLDRKTLGMQRGEVTVLGARPGAGKSALALCVSRATAEAGNKVLLMSLEMGDVALSQRLLADIIFSVKPMPYWVMRSGKFAEADFSLITDAATKLAALPIRIEQQSDLMLSQIAARARQMKRHSGLDLLVIDHVHLIKPSGRYAGNRVNELGEVSSGLKSLAKSLDVAVLALCQLNRAVEGRDDKRPTLADLRASGDIEQDADTVIMLYRESYYLERAKPPAGSEKYVEWLGKTERAHNKLEAIVEKQRNGPIGTVALFCDIACNAIRNAAQDSAQGALEI